MGFESWDDEREINWRLIIIVVALICCLVGAAFAVYKITSPESDPVTVSKAATLSKPTLNATATIIGDTLQITTQLSDNTEALQIMFYENTILVGSAYSDSSGTAIFNHMTNTAGLFVYTADCIHP